MASPTFRSVAVVADATATNCTGTEPAGAAANDILVAYLYIESDTAVTAPSGWTNTFDSTTALIECNTVGDAFRTYGYWIRRGASAPALQWTHASAYRGVTIVAYSGAVTTEEPWSFFTVAVRDDTTAKTYPDVSGTTDTADETLVWAGRFFSESSINNTPPTGFTERNDGLGESTAVSDLAQAVAGSTGTVTGGVFGSTNNRAAGTMMGGLKSVAAGAATVDGPLIGGLHFSRIRRF